MSEDVPPREAQTPVYRGAWAAPGEPPISGREHADLCRWTRPRSRNLASRCSIWHPGAQHRRRGPSGDAAPPQRVARGKRVVLDATLMRGVWAVSVEDVGLACELADRYGSRLAARDLLRAVMLRTGAAKAVTADKDFDELSSGGIGRLGPTSGMAPRGRG